MRPVMLFLDLQAYLKPYSLKGQFRSTLGDMMCTRTPPFSGLTTAPRARSGSGANYMANAFKSNRNEDKRAY